MNKADISLLQLVAEEQRRERGDAAIFQKVGYRGRGRHLVATVSETSLHRLTKAGLVEVETHNVSAWSYGPPMPSYNYRHLHGETAYHQAIVERDAFIAKMQPRRSITRSEIWVRITSLGTELLESLS